MAFLRKPGKRSRFYHLIDKSTNPPTERSLHTNDPEVAKAYWHTYEDTRARMRLGMPAQRAPLREIIKRYQDTINKKPGSKSRDALTFKNFFRHCPIETVEEFSDMTAREFMSKRERVDGALPATINRDMVTLKHFSKMLRVWKYMPMSPLQDVPKLREDEVDTRYFTAAQISQVLADAKGLWYDMWLTAINTGCRLNELLTFHWNKNIDLASRCLIIVAPKTGKLRYRSFFVDKSGLPFWYMSVYICILLPPRVADGWQPYGLATVAHISRSPASLSRSRPR